MSDSPSHRKPIRLNKYLSDCSVASRREADVFISEGRVSINGRKVYELGVRISPEKDQVSVDGKPIKAVTQKLYILMNKPKGVLTTLDDPFDRPTIKSLITDVPYRIFPVGRLDWDSEGLLLLTNDGDFAQKIMHPKSEVTKTYLVKINGHPTPAQIEKLRRGVSIIGGKVSAKHIEKTSSREGKSSSKYDWYKIIISEGKNRQVRQMFSKIGYDVLKLQRISIGRLKLESLKPGQYVFLNDVALKRIFMSDLPSIKNAEKIALEKARKMPSKKKNLKPKEAKPNKFEKM